MAQKSKRSYIVEMALPLFLEHGFKGTSIDLVVKISGVSKPTVYNHFPDKTALILAVVQNWCDRQQPIISSINSKKMLENEIDKKWLSDDSVKFYALVIGEGRRFEEAKQTFWKEFDTRWRQAFAESSKAIVSPAELDLILDQQLLRRLKQL